MDSPLLVPVISGLFAVCVGLWANGGRTRRRAKYVSELVAALDKAGPGSDAHGWLTRRLNEAVRQPNRGPKSWVAGALVLVGMGLSVWSYLSPSSLGGEVFNAYVSTGFLAAFVGLGVALLTEVTRAP